MGDLCQIRLIDIYSNTMINNTKLTLAGVLVAMFLLSFDSVKSDCDCEGPVVNNCCPTGFNGECCEYPILQRSKKPLGEVSPLAQKLKKEAHESARRPTEHSGGRSRGQRPELQLNVLHHVLLVNVAAEEIAVHHLVVNRC